MPRGRPRKKNKLTNAECCRRSLKKRKKENPDLYKTKSAAYSKNIMTRIKTALSSD